MASARASYRLAVDRAISAVRTEQVPARIPLDENAKHRRDSGFGYPTAAVAGTSTVAARRNLAASSGGVGLI